VPPASAAAARGGLLGWTPCCLACENDVGHTHHWFEWVEGVSDRVENGRSWEGAARAGSSAASDQSAASPTSPHNSPLRCYLAAAGLVLMVLVSTKPSCGAVGNPTHVQRGFFSQPGTGGDL